MGIEIFTCIALMTCAVMSSFGCGVAWESSHDFGWHKEGLFWAIFFGLIALTLFVESSLLWIELGRMKVETREMPVVERKITHKECNDVIVSDTLYVFKFE